MNKQLNIYDHCMMWLLYNRYNFRAVTIAEKLNISPGWTFQKIKEIDKLDIEEVMGRVELITASIDPLVWLEARSKERGGNE